MQPFACAAKGCIFFLCIFSYICMGYMGYLFRSLALLFSWLFVFWLKSHIWGQGRWLRGQSVWLEYARPESSWLWAAPEMALPGASLSLSEQPCTVGPQGLFHWVEWPWAPEYQESSSPPSQCTMCNEQWLQLSIPVTEKWLFHTNVGSWYWPTLSWDNLIVTQGFWEELKLIFWILIRTFIFSLSPQGWPYCKQ